MLILIMEITFVLLSAKFSNVKSSCFRMRTTLYVSIKRTIFSIYSLEMRKLRIEHFLQIDILEQSFYISSGLLIVILGRGPFTRD